MNNYFNFIKNLYIYLVNALKKLKFSIILSYNQMNVAKWLETISNFELFSSAWLEEQNGYLSKIKINKVFGFMSHIGAKVSPDYAMPCWVVFLIELFLDECCNILFDVELLECLCWNIDCVLLHILRHVCILYNCFSIRHIKLLLYLKFKLFQIFHFFGVLGFWGLS